MLPSSPCLACTEYQKSVSENGPEMHTRFWHLRAGFYARIPSQKTASPILANFRDSY